MKKIQITPLQPHTTKEPAGENASFLKAFSVISPVFIYYMVCTFINVVFAVWFANATATEAQNGVVAWLIAHSRQTSAVVNVVAMIIGVLFVLPSFRKEGIVYKMPSGHRSDMGLVAILSLAAAIGLNYLFGLLQRMVEVGHYEEVADTQFSLPLFPALLIYGVLSPFAEEIVFRGLVYNRLRRQYGVIIAITGSALIFGLYHGNLIQAGYGFLLGLLMAALYERYSSFIVPFLIHSVANMGIYCIMSVDSLRMSLMTPVSCIICSVVFLITLRLLFQRTN